MSKEVSLAKIVEQFFNLVSELNPEQRRRVMRSIAALLEEPFDSNLIDAHSKGENVKKTRDTVAFRDLSTAVKTWMDRNGVTQHQLEEVFHSENDKVLVIADRVPGETKKDQTVNCYVIEGVRALLETGTAKFADADADALCQRIGCRDKTNHTTYRASAGNKMTGSRKDGFTLVAPGLMYAATVIKAIAAPNAEAPSN